MGHPAAVLRLRLQQGPHRRLRPHRVLDRLPQGQPPGGLHGGAAVVGEGRQGQVGPLPQRVPPHGHQGVPARRQRLRLRLHPAWHRHPLRPVGGAQRGRQRRRRHHLRAQGEGPLRRLQGLPAQGAGHRLQQARDRVAGQVGRVRLARPRPQGPGHGARAGRRRDHRHQEERGHRPGLPVRRDRRRRGPDLRRADPGGGVGQEHAAAVRTRDARPLCVRPPAVRGRAHPGRRGRLLRRGRAGREPGRRAGGDRGRHPERGAAQDHQEGRHVGADPAGGP